jgi:ABC-2 type transport system permease protein
VTAAASARGFTRVIVRQLFADRSALFFMFVLPVAVIVIIGATFGATPSVEVGVVAPAPTAAGDEIVDRLRSTPGVKVSTYDDAEALGLDVRRRVVTIGLVLPNDLDAALVEGTARITVLGEPSSSVTGSARDVVAGVVADVTAPIDAGRRAAELTGAPVGVAISTAERVASAIPVATPTTTDVGDGREASLSRFSLTAPQNLVLFVFINAVAGGAALVRLRRTGVLRRVLAGPTSAGSVILGLGVAWVSIALVQSVLILAVGGLAFGVDWGDPLGAAALTVVFAAVGGGAGLLVGAVGGNEDRVSSIGPLVGIGLGALGGCMIPLEIFPDAMRTVSRAVPHSWAMQGWQQLVFDGESLADITGPLVVLTAFAVVLFVAAAAVLRRSLTR